MSRSQILPREPGASRTRVRRSPSLVRIGVVVIGLLALAGAAFGGWYLFLRPSPAAVSLASLPPTQTQAVGAGSTGPAEAGGASAPAAGNASAGGPDGTWKVDPSIGSFSDFSSFFAGYRVQETLGTIGANTAVGRTPNVDGTLTLSGSTISAVEITVDMTTLRSDNDMRDGRLANQAIEYRPFPTATFRLTAPIELGSVPTDGQTVTTAATGDLTLHGVTRSVTVALQARLSGGVVTVIGSLPITFADYSIQKPQSQLVLSIDDHGTMEFQLLFRPSL